MGNEVETASGMSLYVTILLTLISGAILLNVAERYWRSAKNTFLKKYPLSLPESIPSWFSGIPVFIAISFFYLFFTVGNKLVDAYVEAPILKFQVALALFVLVGSIIGKFLASTDDRSRPYTRATWISLIVSLAIVMTIVVLTTAWCPPHLSEQWWMPCY